MVFHSLGLWQEGLSAGGKGTKTASRQEEGGVSVSLTLRRPCESNVGGVLDNQGLSYCRKFRIHRVGDQDLLLRLFSTSSSPHTEEDTFSVSSGLGVRSGKGKPPNSSLVDTVATQKS